MNGVGCVLTSSVGTSLELSNSHSHRRNVVANASLDNPFLIFSDRVVPSSVIPNADNSYYDISSATTHLPQSYASPVIAIDPRLLALAHAGPGITHAAGQVLHGPHIQGVERDSAQRGNITHRHTAPTSFCVAQSPQGRSAHSGQMGSMYLPPPHERSSPPPRPPQAGWSSYNQVGRSAPRRPKSPQSSWSRDSGVGFGVTRSPTVEVSAALSRPTVNLRALESYGSGAGMPLQPYAELVELRQEPYKDGNKISDSNFYSVPYGSNCRLAILVAGNTSCIPDPHEISLHLRSNGGPLSPKPSFRMQFPNFPKYKRQVNVATMKQSQYNPPTRGWLAILAAREMNRFLERCKLEGKPFKYGLNELYLLRIDCVSSGSLQPRFGVRRALERGDVNQVRGFA